MFKGLESLTKHLLGNIFAFFHIEGFFLQNGCGATNGKELGQWCLAKYKGAYGVSI